MASGDLNPNPLTNADAGWMRRIQNAAPSGALSRRTKLQPTRNNWAGPLIYALPHYILWRGNLNTYRYRASYGVSRYGEGDSMKSEYHQYFSHAKDPLDVNKPGKEFEFLHVGRGKLHMKPLPQVQYVVPGAAPKWHFKSWHDPLESMDPWLREVHYDNHVPTHLGAKRPLAVIAPSTVHRTVQFMNMQHMTFTVSPFLFGFGHTMQKAVMDLYRTCVSGRTSLVPKEKITLFYAIDAVTPKVEVKFNDGTTYRPPITDRTTSFDLLQMVMEQSWLAGDRANAMGKALTPPSIDEYRWHQVVSYMKKKEKKETGKDAKK